MGTPYNYLAYRREDDAEDKPRAYALIVAQPGGDGVIYYMVTRKKYRGKGYMRKIIEEAKQDFNILRTQISASTKESISMLKHLGFEPTGDWVVWTNTSKVPTTSRQSLKPISSYLNK